MENKEEKKSNSVKNQQQNHSNHQQQNQHHSNHQQQNNQRQNNHQNQNQNNQNQNHQNHHLRRKAFESKLTKPNLNKTHSHPQTQSNIDLSLLSLSQRLIQELSTGQYDCSICITPVKPYHPIYHCPNCFTIFHLNCSSKWASCSISDSSSKAILLRDRDQIPSTPDSIRGQWRCPGCQQTHVGPESIPKNYTCWCRKVVNLHAQNNNSHHQHHQRRPKIPHSCGQRCAKVSTHGCVHGCMEICHPGSCPPCPAVIITKCHCQKTQLSIRCSQLYTTRNTTSNLIEPLKYSEELSCDQVCNKVLSCGLHSCQKICHPEPCQPCQVIRDKSCYCARSNFVEEICSNRIEFEDPILTIESQKNKYGTLVCVSPDGKSEWVGEFHCKEKCQWKYQCGIHICNSICHPHLDTTPTQCPYSPELINSCPCGSTPLQSSTRKSCSDPILTCQNICGKLLESCGHPCQKICHRGPCSETSCKTLVTTSCRCGKDKIVRQCEQIEKLKKESLIENSLVPDANERQDETSVLMKAIEYRCERRCRVLRDCGKHICNRTCCPLSFLETFLYQKKSAHSTKKKQDSQLIQPDDPLGLHTCNLLCNKKLSCGSHSCQLQDHKGPCPPCLLASFDPLICNCGLTAIEPPIRCGTRINCQQICKRGRPASDCGHPIIPHQCHEEPDCPPCVYLTSKPCQCDKKNLVKNVRCSQPNSKISCSQKCNNVLHCGAHRCQLICHPIGTCQTCDQVCLKPRKHCGHGCLDKCHAPALCKTEGECQEMIAIKCNCGHRNSKIKCLSCDNNPEGDRNRSLECDNECDLIRRNLVLIEALQINNTKASSSVVENIESSRSRSNPSSSSLVEYSQNLFNIFKSHTAFAKTIESQLDRFLSSPFDLNINPNSCFLIISTFSKLKQNFLIELISYYDIKFQPPVGQEPKFNVKLIKDTKSKKPTKLLSEAAYNEMKEEETEEEEIKKNKKVENVRSNNNSKRVIDIKHLKGFSNSDDRFSNRFNILSSSSTPGNGNGNGNHDNVSNKFSSAWFKSSGQGLDIGHNFGQVISGGFNKPPIAVLAPISSTSTSNVNFLNPSSSFSSSSSTTTTTVPKHLYNKVDDSDVIDDWENET